MRMITVGLLFDTGKRLTRGERNGITPLISGCQMRGAMIIQDEKIRRVVLRDVNSTSSSPL